MAADRILMLKLLGDTSSLDKSLRKSEGRMKSFGRSVQRWGTAIVADLAIQGFEKLTDTIGDAWTGFREGERASAQLGTTWKNLGLDGSKLQTTIDAISRSTLKLGTDDTEAIMAYNRALQTTGGRPKQAMDRLRIAQDLVANGSAPNLTSALGLIQQAAKGSARVVDRFGLKSGTAAGRVKELGDKVRGAARTAAKNDPFGVLENQINEHIEGIVGALSQGELKDALAELEGIGNDVAAAWTTADSKITPALDKMTGGKWTEAKDGASGLASDLQGLVDRVGKLSDSLGGRFSDAFANFTDLLSTLQPYIQTAIDVTQPFVDLLQTVLTGAIGLVVDTASGAFSTIQSLLTGQWATAWDTGVQLVLDLFGNLDKTLGTLPSTLMNLVAPVGEQAAALGRSVLDGVIGFVSLIPKWASGAIDRLVSIIRDGINTVISLWNQLDFRIPAFTMDLPSFRFGEGTILDTGTIGGGSFKVFDGTGDLIPDIPTLGKGGVVNRPTLAMIGEAGPEAVVPLGRGGGMGATYSITVNVAPGGDLVEAGRQMVRAITSFERRSGRVWRAA